MLLMARLVLILSAVVASVHGLSPLENKQSYAAAHKGMLEARVAQAEVRQGRKLMQSSNPYPSNASPPGTTTSQGLYLYTPINSTYLDGDDFANFFYDNYNNNSSPGIALATGNYTVNTATNYKPWVLLFECNANPNRPTQFQVNMSNSVLGVGNMNLAAVGWDTCSNVAFSYVTLTYAFSQQIFTQGTLTGINNANWTIQIDPGYPADPANQIFQQGHTVVFYDQQGRLKQNGSDTYLGPFTNVGPGTYTVPAVTGIPGIYLGLRLNIRGDTYANHMTFCNTCQNFQSLNVTVWSSNIFAMFEANCRNSTYTNAQIVPDPTPRGRPPPLASSNADGIHSVYPFYGPSITNSVVLNTGDDAMAVHGDYYVVGAVNTTGTQSRWNITIGSWDCGDPSCLSTQPGSQMQLYTTSFQDLGAATVKTVTQVPQPQNVSGQSVTFPAFNYNQATYFAITLTAWPRNWTTAAQGGIVTNPLTTGQYCNIVNNLVGNNRARGIYFRGQNSVINQNNITGSSAVGIFLAPDFYFLEANWNYNLTVNLNYINVTNAGIVLSATNLSLQAPIYQNHKNIVFQGNVISGPVHPFISGSATRVNFSNNVILDGCCYPYSQGDIFFNQGGSQGVLVYASYTAASTFSSNVFRTSSAACRYYGNYGSPYVKGPGASGVKTS